MVKIYNNADEALSGILHDDLTIMAGGFGLCGIPENSIKSIYDSGVKNLTIISNNCGIDDFGLGILLERHQIKKMLSSYVGENKTFEQQYLNKEIEGELVTLMTYSMVDKDSEYPPNEGYFETIFQGYQDWKLPVEALEKSLLNNNL